MIVCDIADTQSMPTQRKLGREEKNLKMKIKNVTKMGGGNNAKGDFSLSQTKNFHEIQYNSVASVEWKPDPIF